jgi:hypothetical protein
MSIRSDVYLAVSDINHGGGGAALRRTFSKPYIGDINGCVHRWLMLKLALVSSLILHINSVLQSGCIVAQPLEPSLEEIRRRSEGESARSARWPLL